MRLRNKRLQFFVEIFGVVERLNIVFENRVSFLGRSKFIVHDLEHSALLNDAVQFATVEAS